MRLSTTTDFPNIDDTATGEERTAITEQLANVTMTFY